MHWYSSILACHNFGTSRAATRPGEEICAKVSLRLLSCISRRRFSGQPAPHSHNAQDWKLTSPNDDPRLAFWTCAVAIPSFRSFGYPFRIPNSIEQTTRRATKTTPGTSSGGTGKQSAIRAEQRTEAPLPPPFLRTNGTPRSGGGERLHDGPHNAIAWCDCPGCHNRCEHRRWSRNDQRAGVPVS